MTNCIGRWSPSIALIASLVFITSCDSADSGLTENLFLTHEISEDAQGQPIRFSFTSTDYQTGVLQDVSCNCDLDIGTFLTTQGFIKDDIVSVHVTGAELVMLFPVSERIDFLNEAILKLEGIKDSVTEIANQSSFPDAREVSLQILQNRDVAGFFTRPTFGAILQMDPATLMDDQAYQIGLVLTLQIELSGT